MNKRKSARKSSANSGYIFIAIGIIGIIVIVFMLLAFVLLPTNSPSPSGALEQFMQNYGSRGDCNLSNLSGYVTITVKKIVGEEVKVYKNGGMQTFLKTSGDGIYAIPYNGGEICRVLDYLQADSDIDYARLSPDGSKIVTPLAALKDEAVNDIVIWDLQTQSAHNLTSENNSIDSDPMWSADSTWILFGSQAGSAIWDLYRVYPDGSGIENISYTPDFHEYFPALSADGTQIIFQGKPANSTDYYDYYAMNVDGSNARRLTSNLIQGVEARMLFDERILFSAHLDGKDGFYLYIMNSDGSNQQQLSRERIIAQVQQVTSDAVIFTNEIDQTPKVYQLDLNSLEISTLYP